MSGEYPPLDHSTMPEHPEAREFNRHVVQEIETKAAAIPAAVNEILNAAKDFEWGDDARYWMETGLSEALANAVYHGNMGIEKKDNTDEFNDAIAQAEQDGEIQKRKVHMAADVTKNQITVVIQDEGGEPGREMVKKFRAADPTDKDNLLKSSGRGGLMIEIAFDKVSVESNDLGTKLTLTKSRAPEIEQK